MTFFAHFEGDNSISKKCICPIFCMFFYKLHMFFFLLLVLYRYVYIFWIIANLSYFLVIFVFVSDFSDTLKGHSSVCTTYIFLKFCMSHFFCIVSFFYYWSHLEISIFKAQKAEFLSHSIFFYFPGIPDDLKKIGTVEFAGLSTQWSYMCTEQDATTKSFR